MERVGVGSERWELGQIRATRKSAQMLSTDLGGTHTRAASHTQELRQC
jgi:hypothetical protein